MPEQDQQDEAERKLMRTEITVSRDLGITGFA
jgi:hypothetical protein